MPPYEGGPAPAAAREAETFDYRRYGATRIEEGVKRSGAIDEAFAGALSTRSREKLGHLALACVQFLGGDVLVYDEIKQEDFPHLDPQNLREFARKELRGRAIRDLGRPDTPLERNRMRLSNGLSSMLMFAETLDKRLTEDASPSPVATELHRLVRALLKVADKGEFESFGKRYIGMREKEQEEEKVAIVMALSARASEILDYIEHPEAQELPKAA